MTDTEGDYRPPNPLALLVGSALGLTGLFTAAFLIGFAAG